MKKLEYLRKLLQTLEQVWAPAWAFLKALESPDFTEEMIAVYVELIESSILATKDQIDKGKLETSLSILDKIKNMEAESKAQDEADCEDLLASL